MNQHQVPSIPLRITKGNVPLLLGLATEVMQRQARALGIVLGIHLDEDVPDAVYMDCDKVAWVITTLVGSALRHVRVPGGVVDVHVTYGKSQGAITIAVRDDGPGIPAERLAGLLNRSGWRPGAALGLLLVDDIALAHGGNLQIHSETARSAHFTDIRFTIPARASD
jgi:signal transduction histidine kinase